MQCTTVRIVAAVSDDNQSGFIVINLADFDPAQHEPFDQESADALRAAGQTAPAADVVPAAKSKK